MIDVESGWQVRNASAAKKTKPSKKKRSKKR